MKKLLLGVIAFALIITSCNKYEDEFDDLNAKLDALKAQVAGVAALQTGITALQSQVTALSAAVAALPNPTASITTLGTNLTALTTKVTALQTSLDKLAVDVAAGKVATDAAAVKVAELQAALALTQLDIVKILANTSMYVGNVSITSDAEVDFWTPKIAQLGMINGTLTVTTSGISTTKIAAMNLILKNVNAVIGGQTGSTTAQVTITASSGKSIDLSKLTSVVGDLTAVGTAPSGESIDELQSILNISALTSVTGNLSLDFDGPYALPLLSSVGGTMVLAAHTASTTAPIRTGTTTVDFPLVSVTGTINGGTPNWPIATTVNIAGDMTTFDAAKATTVVLRGNYSAGLVFNAPKATSVSIAAATMAGSLTINAAVATSISLPKLTTTGTGTVGITTDEVTAVTLPLLATSGDITIDMVDNNGSVDLSVFAKAGSAVTVTGPETLSLPKYVTGQLTSTTAKTVTLALHAGVLAPVLPVVETLTIGALNTPLFNISAYTTLKVASITGKSGTTSGATGTTAAVASVTSSTQTKLTSLTLAGPMVSAVVNDQTKLTSLATSGIINSLTVNSCDLLTAVSFAHTHFVGGTLGTGSVLVVTSNPKLTALQTSTNYMSTLTVTGNILLTSMNFSSYVDILYPGSAVNITISGNKISGLYTAPVPQTPTTPWVEAIVKSNDLLTLKAYVAKMTVTAAAITQTLSLDLDDCTTSTSTSPTLSSLMLVGTLYNAVTCPTVIDATGGINIPAEMALVVAN